METPEFFQANYCNTQLATEKRLSDAKNSDHFIIEDLFDFPSDENMPAADGGLEAATAGTSTESTVDNSCNSSFSNLQAAGIGGPGEGPFAGDLCVPYDEMAELEWLSNFVEDSFSSEDPRVMESVKGQQPESSQHQQAGPTIPSVPAKARSKRSRAAPGNWASRLLVVGPKPKKKEVAEEGRKCLHCATDKTPQWRTGPMGPKTLCNACGVRYKSGRLVPEYRPASSPTFVLSKHSNSHRKVLELRRQKEMLQQQLVHNRHHQHHGMIFDASNEEDYLIPHPDFRHMI
ncbi:GATA transcription factor [Striga asiatica]|uniref:GATA transcription factor n=1 Tax=Striga asiatica TaxID=4170 RepID=A0A5A7PZ65_STRAF|nr:GATA transcription factor [Striga asiatica]